MKKDKPVFTQEEKKGILGLSCIFFFRMLGLFLILPVFSVFALELRGATHALIGVAFGAYGLTQASLQIPFGSYSDRIGRKPVIAFGLILFIIGSVLGALAQNIYLMIIGRFLQGAGAISSTVFALIADLTRDEVRARANAGLGVSISIAFAIALVTAPLLGSRFGLSGIFWCTTILAVLCLIVLFTLVPTPDPLKVQKNKESTWIMMKEVFQIRHLLTIDLGAFVISMGLASAFFITPLFLKEFGYEKVEIWKFYLPMLLAGVIAMIPSAILAEVKNRFREVMLVGAAILLLSFFLLWWGQTYHSLLSFLSGLYLFFMGFNVFEPLFPSLVTRMTSQRTKGTASGVYNLFQFIGYFAGATIAGFFYTKPLFLTFILITLSLFFILRLMSFPNPEPKKKEYYDITPN